MASVVSDFAFNLFYQIVIIIAPLITVPYISRIIGPEGIGIFSYTKSIADYFLLAAMLGMLNHGNRSIATLTDNIKKRNQMFWSLLAVQALTAALATGVYSVYAFRQPGDATLLSRIFTLYVASAFFNIEWFLAGSRQFKRMAVRNCFVKLASIAGIFLFVKTRGDLWLYGAIMVGSQLLTNLLLWPGVIRSISFEKPNLQLILKQIKPILMLFLPTVAVSFYKYLDKILLGQLGSMEQVGFLDNAEKLVSIILGVSLAFNTVMLPRMSHLAAKKSGRAQGRKITLDSMVMMTIIAIPLSFGLMAVSEKIALILFGPAFEECGELIQSIALTIPFICWGGVIRTQLILPYNMDMKLSVALLTGAAFNLVINLALIPRMGARGAVYGIVLTEALVCLIQMWLVRRDLEFQIFVRKGSFILANGLFMFFILRLVDGKLKLSIASLAIEIVLGVVIYTIPMILFLKHTGDLNAYSRLLRPKSAKEKSTRED